MWVQAMYDTDDTDMAIGLVINRTESISIGLSKLEALRLARILRGEHKADLADLALAEKLQEAVDTV